MNPWRNFEAATCLPNKCQCETPREALIRQPSAFYSTLFVLLVPWLLYRKHGTVNRRAVGWMLALVVLSISSFLGHGTFTRLGVAFDFASIVMVIGYFPLMKKLERFPKRWSFSAVLAFFALSVWAMYDLPREVKVSLCVGTVALAIYDLVQERARAVLRDRSFLLSFSTLFVSFALFLLDENHVACSPESWFQFHSLWHLGVAVTLYYFGKFRLVAVNI